MIEVRHLTRTYLSRRSPKSKEPFVSVNDVSFSLLENTPYALVGESGSGKSTLAMIHCFMDKLSQQEDIITTFDEELWYTTVDVVKVSLDGKMTFVFRDGSTVEVPME